jgi:hypothetical protein
MPGECEKCDEHTLDCACEDEPSQIGFAFAMPMGERLEVRSSEPIDILNIDQDEEIDDVFYEIFWNDVALPWTTATKLQAMAIALGCQWGAFETAKRMRR